MPGAAGAVGAEAVVESEARLEYDDERNLGRVSNGFLRTIGGLVVAYLLDDEGASAGLARETHYQGWFASKVVGVD